MRQCLAFFVAARGSVTRQCHISAADPLRRGLVATSPACHRGGRSRRAQGNPGFLFATLRCTGTEGGGGAATRTARTSRNALLRRGRCEVRPPAPPPPDGAALHATRSLLLSEQTPCGRRARMPHAHRAVRTPPGDWGLPWGAPSQHHRVCDPSAPTGHITAGDPQRTLHCPTPAKNNVE